MTVYGWLLHKYVVLVLSSRSERGGSRGSYNDDKPRSRRESAGSPDSRNERRVIPSRAKRDSAPAPDLEDVDVNADPYAIKPPPKDDSKLVPAPPPKENVWAKRKEQPTSPEITEQPEKSIASPAPEKATPAPDTPTTPTVIMRFILVSCNAVLLFRNVSCCVYCLGILTNQFVALRLFYCIQKRIVKKQKNRCSCHH